jgi:hypothetical protein
LQGVETGKFGADILDQNMLFQGRHFGGKLLTTARVENGFLTTPDPQKSAMQSASFPSQSLWLNFQSQLNQKLLFSKLDTRLTNIIGFVKSNLIK